MRKLKAAFKKLTKVHAIAMCAVLFVIILSVTLVVTLSGDVNANDTTVGTEPKCVEEKRTFYPTIDGFKARSDHIPQCLQTCGNEGNTETAKWGKIINGETPDMNSWPFLVKLSFWFGGEGSMCGGTVLNNRNRSII